MQKKRLLLRLKPATSDKKKFFTKGNEVFYVVLNINYVIQDYICELQDFQM